jgi:hypothetical protein
MRWASDIAPLGRSRPQKPGLFGKGARLVIREAKALMAVNVPVSERGDGMIGAWAR